MEDIHPAWMYDALKWNYQFLEALHMMMHCHCKLYGNIFHAFY